MVTYKKDVPSASGIQQSLVITGLPGLSKRLALASNVPAMPNVPRKESQFDQDIALYEKKAAEYFRRQNDLATAAKVGEGDLNGNNTERELKLRDPLRFWLQQVI